MAYWQVEFLRRVAGQSDDAGDLFRRKPWRCAAAVFVGEELSNLFFERVVILWRLGLDAAENLPLLGEPLTPPSNPLRIDAKSARLLYAQIALSGPQHNLGALDDTLGFGPRPRQSCHDGSLAL